MVISTPHASHSAPCPPPLPTRGPLAPWSLAQHPYPLLGTLSLIQFDRLLVLVDAQLGRLEGLQALPHGSVEDLLVLLLIFVLS